MPLVSVVIPTFGRTELLRRALRSVARQTMTDLEIVVVVDGQDPETVAMLELFGDHRLHFVEHGEKQGASKTRNRGVAESASPWIAFLDDDDEWLPEKLEKQLAAAPDSVKTIVTALSHVVTPLGSFVRPTDPYSGAQPIDEWLFSRRSWFRGGESMLQTSSLLLPKTLLERLPFGQVRHEEWELAIRAVKLLGYRLVTVPEPLVIYYAGNYYPWRPSAEWIDSLRDVVSAAAYSGFCLNVATQGLRPEDRKVAMQTLFGMALRHGRPTVRQIFAFVMIWLVPDLLRLRLRVLLRGVRSQAMLAPSKRS